MLVLGDRRDCWSPSETEETVDENAGEDVEPPPLVAGIAAVYRAHLSSVAVHSTIGIHRLAHFLTLCAPDTLDLTRAAAAPMPPESGRLGKGKRVGG